MRWPNGSSGCCCHGSAIAETPASAAMPPVLSADRVTKEFAVGGGQRLVAIRDLSLSVHEGEFVCILGASGCGKSTLLNIFAGFLRPSAGRVLLHGEPILGIEPRCGMVFQSYALFPWKTVRGNV